MLFIAIPSVSKISLKSISFSKTARLPMMHMDDCIRATEEFLLADENELKTRTYNVTGMSFTPRELATGIQKYMPDFELVCRPDFRFFFHNNDPFFPNLERSRKFFYRLF